MRPMGVVSRALRRPETYAGMARELAGAAHCAARYPLGLIDLGLSVIAPSGREALRPTPVVLVHGYGHNRSGWFLMERHLRRAGFDNVVTLNYNPLAADVPLLADRLARRVERVLTATGGDAVHLVGHSLGGIIVRWFVQERGGHEHVRTAVTIASPHEGTLAAVIGVGRTLRQLVPGSWVMRRLHAGARPSDVRWVAYYSNLDVLVQPARSAMLRHPALAAENVLVKDLGHLSLLLSPGLARDVVDRLARADDGAGRTGGPERAAA